MRSKSIMALALGVALVGQSAQFVWAARKYYPPGFKPPTDQNLVPSSAPAESPVKTQVIIQQPSGGKQIIIKTVPVTVEKVVPVLPKPRDPLLVLMDEGRYFDALRMVEQRLKKSPNNQSWQLLRAEILRKSGDYNKSLEQYYAILEKAHTKSRRAEVQNGIGWTYYQRSIHEKQVGNLVASNASLRAADTAFRQAAQLEPDMPYAWAGLGEVALANGQAQDAEVWIKKAKRLGPNKMVVQLAEANLLLAQKKPEEALQILYGVKKTTTREPEVYMLLARGSLDIGKVDDAIINLKQLLELEPDHTEALKLLSQSYERKMKPEDAEVALEKAISLNPMDEKSVDALLKIYEQRGQSDRGLLVLKTLLKDKPGQTAYGLALLQRLANSGRWDEVYDEGSKFIAVNFPDKPEAAAKTQDPAVQAQKAGIISLFARSVYQKGKGMLDRGALISQPPVKKAQMYAQLSLDRDTQLYGPFSGQSLTDRLSLLLIDPMRSLPPLPDGLRPQAQDLPLAIQIAYLQGNHGKHSQWVSQATTLENKLPVATTLYELGDYQGANLLVDSYLSKHSDSAEARQLKRKIAADQVALQEHLDILEMLPKRIPDGYWHKTASEVLELGSTDGKAHAVLGTALEKRRQRELAVIQMRLAAKYADTQQDREYWTRRADKAARNLSRERSR